MASIPVLCFHKITDDHEWGVTTYSPVRFARLMKLLKERGFNFCLPDEISDFENPLIITFDDGYESVLKNAVPVLKKNQSPSVIFPIINYIGKLNNWDANIGGIKFRHLDDKQIDECMQSKSAIGSHGMTHRAFSLLTENEVLSELEESFRYLENRLKIGYKYLAAPFGESVNNYIMDKVDFYFNLDGNLWDGKRKTISRIPVYRYETPEMVLSKIYGNPVLNRLSRLVHQGAKATVLMQKING